jgi:hypothetical protein
VAIFVIDPTVNEGGLTMTYAMSVGLLVFGFVLSLAFHVPCFRDRVAPSAVAVQCGLVLARIKNFIHTGVWGKPYAYRNVSEEDQAICIQLRQRGESDGSEDNMVGI